MTGARRLAGRGAALRGYDPCLRALATERVRVLFVHSTLEIGGAEEVRLCLLSCLDRSRYEAIVCCLQSGGPIADEIAALGYEVIVFGRRAHAFSLPTLISLRRLIRQRRPHIVQTSLPRANYWGRMAAALERVPVVIAEEHNVRESSDWARPVIERVLGPTTDTVIAVSAAVRDAITLESASRSRPTVVIPNPVNEKRLQAQRQRAEVRGELRINPDVSLVVHVGRMDETASNGGQKGHDTLLEALAYMRVAGRAVACALLGDGPGRASLEALATKLHVADCVRFLGFRRDVADILAAADVFAFPSRWEGMPIALMEAMWMGVPVVASDIAPDRETLGDGAYGRLVPVESPAALSAAICDLLENEAERARLGQQARAHARTVFSPQQYAARVADLWEELVARKLGGQ